MDYLLSFLMIFICLLNGFAILKISGVTLQIDKLKPLNFGLSYFIGILFLIVTIRIFSFIFSNASIGLFSFASFSILIFIFYSGYLFNLFKNNIKIREIIFFIFLFITLFLVLLVYWLKDTNINYIGAFVGSLHSVKYVNLAEYILQNNYIPIIGQNTGQSIITYLLLFTGAKSGYVVLTTFLVASIIFLILIVYDLFNLFLNNKVLSIFATFIFFMANTALSTSHILIIDSGSPLFLNGYSDTIVGVAIIIILTILYSGFSKFHKINFSFYPLILLLLIGSFFVAPQNIPLLIGAIILISIFRIPVKHKYIIGVMLFFSLIISIPQGGMLTPSSLQDKPEIDGMVQLFAEHTKDNPLIRVNPGLLFHIHHIDTFDSSNHYERRKFIEVLLNKPNLQQFKLALFYFEETAITSIRMLFFPITGFILLFLYFNRFKERYHIGSDIFDIRLLKTLGLSVFLIGFFIAFFFDIRGFKWEMSRFTIPGIVFGMFSFILFIFLIIQNNRSNIRLKILVLIIVTSIGPVSNFLLIMQKRIFENSNSDILENRYKAFSNIQSE